MTEREGMEPRDLASRWEEAIHGRATPEEIRALRREAGQAGRLAEFEAQAEAAAAVRGLASRHHAPAGLRERAARLGAGRLVHVRQVWWAAAAGALAASLLLAAGLRMTRETPGTPFAVLAQDARAEFVRASLEREPSQTRARELARIAGWFEPRVNFRPQVFFSGNDETKLEGARVGIADGVKVASYLYRWQGKPVVLVIFPAHGSSSWTSMPEKRWSAARQGDVTVCVWRRGKYIYSLVGDVSTDKMKELSQQITPPDQKIDS